MSINKWSNSTTLQKKVSISAPFIMAISPQLEGIMGNLLVIPSIFAIFAS